MDILIWTAQAAGVCAMILTVLSLQCRSNRNFFICQEAAGGLFAASFFMLGAYSGALMNLFGVIRPEILRRENCAKSKWTLFILLLSVICFSLAVFFFRKEKWYLILLVTAAQIAGTSCMWSRNGKLIRIGQLLAVSPLWITYNLLLPIPSIGGILTEIICIFSSIIALFRYRKSGFTER